MSRGFFITGTDTDVGKTSIALGLMAALQQKGLRVAAMKPVSAGCELTADGLRNDDALRLMDQASIQLPYEIVNPYAFEPACAPHIAAAETGVEMQIEPLVEAYHNIATQVDVVIVEGAGGWLVPLNNNHSMADLAAALMLPVINVVGIQLGCLSHALLTEDSIKSHGLTQAGWVANQLTADMPYLEDNINYLKERIEGQLIGNIPFNSTLSSDDLVQYLDINKLLY